MWYEISKTVKNVFSKQAAGTVVFLYDSMQNNKPKFSAETLSGLMDLSMDGKQ